MSGHGVVLVGGGLASQRCAEMLRRKGFEGAITLVTGEEGLPYDRPPLSKGFLTGEVTLEGIEFRNPDWYREAEVELLTGSSAIRLDPEACSIDLDVGTQITFRNLVIATGARPRRLPGLDNRANVHYLRSAIDSLRLRTSIETGSRVVIIGGGFIGQEIASSALALGANVVIVEALTQPLAGIVGEEVGSFFAAFHRERGVEVICGKTVVGAIGDPEITEVELDDGTRLACDLVVVGIGTEPEIEWLEGSGLASRDGILIDANSRTSAAGIYAAGDVAKSPDPVLGRPTRSEHWEAAVHQGRAAALDIVGDKIPPRSLPSFWSDQHGSRFQFVGYTEDADEVEVREGSSAGSLVATWFHTGRPVGALTLDDPRSLAEVRRSIRQASRADDLLGDEMATKGKRTTK